MSDNLPLPLAPVTADLLRVHSLVGRLSDAEYSCYYPLSRAQPAMVDELFVRLATGGSNLVHQLADVLQVSLKGRVWAE